jgi:hypothetical protein
MPKFFVKIIAFLLVVSMVVDPAMGSMCPVSNDIAGRRDLPLQFPFTSQALAPALVASAQAQTLASHLSPEIQRTAATSRSQDGEFLVAIRNGDLARFQSLCLQTGISNVKKLDAFFGGFLRQVGLESWDDMNVRFHSLRRAMLGEWNRQARSGKNLIKQKRQKLADDRLETEKFVRGFEERYLASGKDAVMPSYRDVTKAVQLAHRIFTIGQRGNSFAMYHSYHVFARRLLNPLPDAEAVRESQEIIGALALRRASDIRRLEEMLDLFQHKNKTTSKRQKKQNVVKEERLVDIDTLYAVSQILDSMPIKNEQIDGLRHILKTIHLLGKEANLTRDDLPNHGLYTAVSKKYGLDVNVSDLMGLLDIYVHCAQSLKAAAHSRKRYFFQDPGRIRIVFTTSLCPRWKKAGEISSLKTLPTPLKTVPCFRLDYFKTRMVLWLFLPTNPAPPSSRGNWKALVTLCIWPQAGLWYPRDRAGSGFTAWLPWIVPMPSPVISNRD